MGRTIARGVVVAVGLMALMGCVEHASQLGEGEACRSTTECGPGLVCLGEACVVAEQEQRRRPDAGVAPRQSEEDAGRTFPDLPPPQDVDRPDVASDVPDPPPDVSPDVAPDVPDDQLCEPGDAECASNRQIRICAPDGESYGTEQCAQGTWCLNARCVARPDCSDADGDGFDAGDDCVGNRDCNDSNGSVFPGALELCNGLDDDCDGQADEDLVRGCTEACGAGVQRCVGGRWPECSVRQPEPERCDNGFDDNCDGRVDENCGMCCTPGSCPGGELCVDCACRPAPPNRCEFQNQPCEPGVADNPPFYCLEFGGLDDTGICVGICDPNVTDPAATCPDADSICLLADEAQGICLDACDAASQTGCFEGQGCVQAGAGACFPAGDVPEGQPCDIDRGAFGACEAGTGCIEIFEPGGTCERLCNPFAEQEGRASACDADSACFPFAHDVGVCVPALDLDPGEGCRRAQSNSILSMCREQSICTRARGGEFACQTLCRMDGRSNDCPGGTTCRPAPIFQDIPGVGVCR